MVRTFKDQRYPGLGERWGRPATQGLGIRVPANSIRRLTEKIVRGVYFLEGQKFVEPPYVIHFYALTDEGAAPIEEILDQFGQEYSRGPGIVIRRAISQDDSMSAVFEIVVWAQFKMYASILASRIDDLERAGGEFDRRKEGGD